MFESAHEGYGRYCKSGVDGSVESPSWFEGGVDSGRTMGRIER